MLLMLGFYGVVMLIWKNTKVFAERCGVCIEVGSSPSVSSSVPHGIVSSVTTSMPVAFSRKQAREMVRRANS